MSPGPAVRPITLDALPELSPWPARLLGLSEVLETDRTPEHIYREFHVDKYGSLLAEVERNPSLSLEQVRQLELGDPNLQVVMSIGHELFGTSLAHASDRFVAMQLERIAAVVARARAATIVDLGCGYGYMLARLRSLLPTIELRGGDYAPSGVMLAEQLHRDDERLTVERFDFLSPGRCGPLEAARPPVVAITTFALHQLPSAAPAIELLHGYADRIDAVVTLEPEDELFGSSLLGLMRRRYQQVNDYSADVLRTLRERDDVEVETLVPNMIGVNALLPATLAVWRFKR